MFGSAYLKSILITVLPLHWSIIHRDFETTKYLLGNNVNKASSDGLTCLMHAVRVVSHVLYFHLDWQHSLIKSNPTTFKVRWTSLRVIRLSMFLLE